MFSWSYEGRLSQFGCAAVGSIPALHEFDKKTVVVDQPTDSTASKSDGGLGFRHEEHPIVFQTVDGLFKRIGGIANVVQSSTTLDGVGEWALWAVGSDKFEISVISREPQELHESLLQWVMDDGSAKLVSKAVDIATRYWLNGLHCVSDVMKSEFKTVAHDACLHLFCARSLGFQLSGEQGH